MEMTAPHELEEVLLELLPAQGRWDEASYLWLTNDTNRLIEFTDGAIEVLPMPTDEHQTLSLFLLDAFRVALGSRGVIRYSPLRMQIRPGKFREPDLLLLLDRDDARRANRYWTGADLVIEIVSPDKPERDLVDKRFDYAEAGIPEYWIVNPLDQSVTILVLDGDTYRDQSPYSRGQHATSNILSDLTIDIAALFDAR